jgi:hypothetical protein
MERFPAVVRLRPLADSVLPAYDVVGLLNLDNVCAEGRRGRPL